MSIVKKIEHCTSCYKRMTEFKFKRDKLVKWCNCRSHSRKYKYYIHTISENLNVTQFLSKRCICVTRHFLHKLDIGYTYLSSPFRQTTLHNRYVFKAHLELTSRCRTIWKHWNSVYMCIFFS